MARAIWTLLVITLLILGLGQVFSSVALVIAAISVYFVFGGAWFWSLIIAASILIIYSNDEGLDRDYLSDGDGSLSTATMLLVFVILQFFSNVKIFSSLFTWSAGYWIAGYFVAGVFWSAIKWWRFLIKRRKMLEGRSSEFFRQHGITDSLIPRNLENNWQSYVGPYCKKPLILNNKKRVLLWMCYWPWSFTWTFLSDFVKKIFKNILDLSQKFYQKIADHVWKDVKAPQFKD